MIYGKSFENFNYKECINGKPDFELIYNMITNGCHNGTVLYVIRDYNSQEICDLILENFDQMLREKGTNRENDGYVNVSQIGSSQFAKSGSEYIKETIDTSHSTLSLFEGLDDITVSNVLMDDFLEEHFIGNRINYGPARFKSSFANFSTIRRWLVNGEMSLHPHEDIAQLEYARKDNFEIYNISNTIACNACIKDSNHGGELMIWNVLPSESSRKENKVFDTGYPYRLEDLQNYESISIKLNQGDIYFMNASLIHGVTPCEKSERTTMGRFIGQPKPNKVVYWT